MSKHQEQIVAAATGKVDGAIVAAAFAKPRGAQIAASGGGAIAAGIGRHIAGKQAAGAGAVGIRLGNPGAVAVTADNLVTMQVKVSLMGAIKEVTEVLSTVPLAEIESFDVKRVGMAGVAEITADGGSFKLEGKVDDLRNVAEAFERSKVAT
jgi:outer membrane receptor protein involved in Fe transport